MRKKSMGTLDSSKVETTPETHMVRQEDPITSIISSHTRFTNRAHQDAICLSNINFIKSQHLHVIVRNLIRLKSPSPNTL